MKKTAVLLLCHTIVMLTFIARGQNATRLMMLDTRNINPPPGYYTQGSITEFKRNDSINAPIGGGVYGSVLTIAPWSDASGGKYSQLLINGLGMYLRQGVAGQPAWEEWRKLVIPNVSGNVGIGVENPPAKLGIGSLANSSISSIKIGIANDPGVKTVPLGAVAGGYNIDFATWRDMAPDQAGARIRAERINIYQANNALVQGMDLCFYTSTASNQTYLTERLRVKYNGQVGIGTASIPANYKLAVAGKMIAEEIKIQLQGSSGWPDYVFKPSYKLMPLHKVEAFIKTNGHLPEVPSAKEVEGKGIEIGANQALLLKKIEELTLYMIELKKENEGLKKEMAAFKKAIQKK